MFYHGLFCNGGNHVCPLTSSEYVIFALLKLIGEHIVISDIATDYLKNFLDSGSYTKIIVLADETTRAQCLPKLSFSYDKLITIAPGEVHKNLESCEHIWSEMLDAGADRHSLLINLGGGVIGDMGGFCAATFMRGIDFVNVPTTLLAMVDASCGGKLGIDFRGLKNYIGLFAEPRGVFIQPSFLDTLGERYFRSGQAEMFKHGLIADAQHWNELRDLNRRRLKLLIESSVSIKYVIVDADTYEENERKKLNFGHTVGHAVESILLERGIEVFHGEAVAAGMIIEALISRKAGLKEDEVREIREVISGAIHLPDIRQIEVSELFSYMTKDKKNREGIILCTLLSAIGSAVIDQPVNLSELEQALSEYLYLSAFGD